MKISYLFILVGLINCTSFAQTKFRDNLKYKVTYNLTYSLDSTALQETKSEYMILLTGDEFSVFSSRAKTLANGYEITGNKGEISRQAITDFQYVIHKNADLGKIYFTQDIVKDQFYYIQEMNQFDWKIHPETKTIEDYKVQKATTTFAGRNYVSWFTTEIPIPEGPYKFNGLPGLILEIADTENHYVFKFVGLEKLTPKLPFSIDFKDFFQIEKGKLEEIWYTYRKDPSSYTNNPKISMSPENHRKLVRFFTEKLKRENNSLELQ